MSAPSATVAAPAGADGSAALPRGLPVHLTRLVGRGRELDEARRQLQATRLLTVTGAGGSGKTRLAVEVAARAAPDFVDGVVWVELATLHDASLLPQQVAAAIGSPESRKRSSLAELVDALHDRALLLVLDNCEHHVVACAQLAESLLRSCPDLRILATSREALGIAGERAWLIPPLSLPGEPGPDALAAIASSEAVQLFVERAVAVAPAFALTDANAAAVAKICRRLDGIPLAIELAAARVKVLAPEQIAERLDDSFRLLTTGGRTALPRHRTLRETIDWSYALLSAPEQAVFQRLSVFAGGFTLDAAESVCAGQPVEDHEVLDLLSALVDKSLVMMELRPDGARYRLLETVRQYARDRLNVSGEAELARARHARFFLQWAESAEPHLFGGAGEPDWIGRVEREYDNLRVAQEWCAEDPDRVETALRLVTAIHWFWFARGRFREGHRRLSTALQRADRAPPAVRARALIVLAQIAAWQGDYGAVRAPAEESVAILRGENDPASLAYALAALGIGLCLSGEAATSAPAFDEAIAIERGRGDSVLLAFTLYWAGIAAQARGEFERARAWFDDAISIGRRLGHRPAVAHPLTVLGRLTLTEGDYAVARAQLAEALDLHARTEDRWGAVMAMESLARIAFDDGRHDRFVRLIGAATAVREVMSAWLAPGEQEELNRLSDAARAGLGALAYDAAWEAGYAMSFERAVAVALEDGDGAAEPAGPEPPGPGVGSAARAADEGAPRATAAEVGAPDTTAAAPSNPGADRPASRPAPAARPAAAASPVGPLPGSMARRR